MTILVPHHSKILAEHPIWGKHAHSVELVIANHGVTNYHTPGLTFHVSDNGVEISTTPKPMHQSADDYKRTLDAVKQFNRLGVATKQDVIRAATAYRDKVWADCDRAKRRRPRMSIDMLAMVR